MISRFLPLKSGDTVLNYYALPLVSLSRMYFGTNFITTRVNRNGTKVFVELKEDLYSPESYPNKVEIGDKFYLFYEVPDIFVEDLKLIIQGAYSKISNAAKQVIAAKSGLMFNQIGPDGLTYTSKLLYALNKDQVLRDYYFEALKSNNAKVDARIYQSLCEVELAELVEEADLL